MKILARKIFTFEYNSTAGPCEHTVSVKQQCRKCFKSMSFCKSTIHHTSPWLDKRLHFSIVIITITSLYISMDTVHPVSVSSEVNNMKEVLVSPGNYILPPDWLDAIRTNDVIKIRYLCINYQTTLWADLCMLPTFIIHMMFLHWCGKQESTYFKQTL